MSERCGICIWSLTDSVCCAGPIACGLPKRICWDVQRFYGWICMCANRWFEPLLETGHDTESLGVPGLIRFAVQSFPDDHNLSKAHGAVRLREVRA